MSRWDYVQIGFLSEELPWKTLLVNDRPNSVQLIKVTCYGGMLSCWYYYCYNYFYYIAVVFSLTFVNLLVMLNGYGDNVQYT